MIGSGDQKPPLCEFVEVCVPGSITEAEVDHWIETLFILGEARISVSRRNKSRAESNIVVQYEQYRFNIPYLVEVLVLNI